MSRSKKQSHWHLSGKGYEAISKVGGLETEETLPGMAGLQKLLQEYIESSSRNNI